MTGPLQITGSSSSGSKRLMDMIFFPSFASHGKIFSPSPFAFSWIPYIFGMDGPVISASMIPTENPCSLISLASDAVTIDFPTPPFPLTTAITWLMCDFLFSGLIRLCGLLPHSPAWEQPAQSDGLQPVFCSSAICLTPLQPQ